MDKEVLHAVSRFGRWFKWLLGVVAFVILVMVVLRVWVLDVPVDVVMPNCMLGAFLGICMVLSVVYLRIRCVMLRGIEDCYRNDVIMKLRAADIGWWCMMAMAALLVVFVFILDNI